MHPDAEWNGEMKWCKILYLLMLFDHEVPIWNTQSLNYAESDRCTYYGQCRRWSKQLQRWSVGKWRFMFHQQPFLILHLPALVVLKVEFFSSWISMLQLELPISVAIKFHINFQLILCIVEFVQKIYQMISLNLQQQTMLLYRLRRRKVSTFTSVLSFMDVWGKCSSNQVVAIYLMLNQVGYEGSLLLLNLLSCRGLFENEEDSWAGAGSKEGAEDQGRSDCPLINECDRETFIYLSLFILKKKF